LLRQAFRKVIKRHPFKVDAFVLLPDHLHCIWTLPQGDADFSTRWRLIKSYFSRQIGLVGWVEGQNPILT
jgi:putative transposase